MTIDANGPSNGFSNGHGSAAAKTPVHSAAPAFGFSTRSIHVGSSPDAATGAVIPPISLSTTYAQTAIGVHKGFEYSRSGNPNRDALEAQLAAIEAGGTSAVAYASGSAVTGSLVMLAEHLAREQNDGARAHIVAVNDVYGGTWRYMTHVSQADVTRIDLETATEEALTAAIQDNTKLVWIETPTNPTMRLIDIRFVVDTVRKHPSRPVVLVDNTFMSPYYQSPLLQGADIVMHSLTKYINGHSDVVGGALILPEHHSSSTPSSLLTRLRYLQNAVGAVPSPFDCALVQRGAKTLALRMKAHGTNALAVASFLSTHPLIERVSYPGLRIHPLHTRALKSLSPHAQRWIHSLPEERVAQGVPYGGMTSFVVRGDSEEHRGLRAEKFLTSTKLFTLAESLGGVESLAEHPARMTHMTLPEEERLKLGISAGLVRLSVGVEDVDDLLEDVRQALEAAAKV